jgi:YD repeat-containing protein
MFGYDPNGNKTGETEIRPGKPNRVTTYAYNKANWLVATTDPGNGTTTYSYDAAGNRIGTTDPLGISTAVTYNSLNLPTQTTHTQGGTQIDGTTNAFDARNNLTRAVTTVANGLVLTTTTTFNANNYLTQRVNSQSGTYSGSEERHVMYQDNNLVSQYGPTGPYGDASVIYDGAGRVNCWQNYGAFWGPWWWAYYPDGNRKDYYYGFNPVAVCYPGEPSKGGLSNASHDMLFYTGTKLTRNETRLYSLWNPNDPLLVLRTYNYDSGGNLTSEVRADYTTNITTTKSYNWMWQASAYRLTNFTATNGVTTTLDYDSAGRITRRYTALGYSDYTYEDGTNWLVRETWRSAISGNTFDLIRYRYANGQPNYVEIAQGPGDLSAVWSYDQRYLQSDWHGDLVRRVWLNGDAGTEWSYDPWGNSVRGLHYYEWNGAWGYMAFGALQMYYVHGRWYNPEMGIFMSPDGNGSYIYFNNDPINKHADAPPPRANYPSECLGGLTSLNNPRDLTCWLFREMKHNLDDSRLQAISQANRSLSFISAASQFYNLVADRKPWDFKHKILRDLGPGITLCSESRCVRKVEYSVPGNIHFGFVAREAGYPSAIVHAGAASAEIRDPAHDPNSQHFREIYNPVGKFFISLIPFRVNLGDDPQDNQAIEFGMRLYDKYANGRGLNYIAFQQELSIGLIGFANTNPFPWPVNDNVARYWPYPVGYFNPEVP